MLNFYFSFIFLFFFIVLCFGNGMTNLSISSNPIFFSNCFYYWLKLNFTALIIRVLLNKKIRFTYWKIIYYMYLNGIISSTHVLVILTELIWPSVAQQILFSIKKTVGKKYKHVNSINPQDHRKWIWILISNVDKQMTCVWILKQNVKNDLVKLKLPTK